MQKGKESELNKQKVNIGTKRTEPSDRQKNGEKERKNEN
jgi:hypothetical protein